MDFIAPCSGGSFDHNIDLNTLGETTWTLQASQTNASGTGSDSIQIIKDVTAPTMSSVTMHNPSAALGNDSTPQIRLAGQFELGQVGLFSDAACSSEIVNGAATSDIEVLEANLVTDGDYSFYGQVIDPAGNPSACLGSADYRLDTFVMTPTTLSLIDPATSPNTDPTPTIRISGIESGDIINLFTTSNCAAGSKVSFSQAISNSIDLTVDAGALSSDGSFNFYAQAEDAAGNISGCSTNFASYTLDTSPPSDITSIAVIDPVSSPSTDLSPTLRFQGVQAGDEIFIYLDSLCTNLHQQVSASGSPFDYQISDLPTEGSYNFYGIAQDPAGNRSDCSSGSANYVVDISDPTLTSVSIASSGSSAIVGLGGTIELLFTSSEQLQTPTVFIAGAAAIVNQINGTSFSATLVVDNSHPDGPVSFSIDYNDLVGNAGVTVTTTTDASSLSIQKTDNSPSLSIADQAEQELTTFSYDINDANTGNDTDLDGDTLTYSCYYDQAVDGFVNTTNSCSSLFGFSLNAGTGEISWPINYSQAGTYEIKIIADEGDISEGEIFRIDVSNNNLPPMLASPGNQSVTLNDLIQINFNDQNSGTDYDLDGDSLNYSCTYDFNIDGTVSSGNNCSAIAGLSFSTSSGFFNWSIQSSNLGTFEIKIEASDGEDTGSAIFVVDVIIDNSKLPQLSMVGSATTAYVASLGDENQVFLKSSFHSTRSAGEVFTITTDQGDLLECTKGCYTITPIDGTAAWATKSYASQILSTYLGRYAEAKVVVAAFDDPADISINQVGVTHVTDSIPANTVREYEFPHNVGALWIESTSGDVAAYVSTRSGSSGNYDRDGRIITAADLESLAFVSGTGGTPTGISSVEDGAVVDVYRNDGSNFENINLDIGDIYSNITSNVAQNGAGSAVAIYSTKKVVATQHADSDGTNASPSLPRSMLSTHFVNPLDGDYVSLASFQEGEVKIIDNTNTVISTVDLTRDPGAHALAPYAMSYNISNIPAGTRFVCTVPCLGILEVRSNDDETLMTGTIKSPFSSYSPSFASGSTIPDQYTGHHSGTCSEDNDFPGINWDNLPWGAKYVAVVVEDLNNFNFVHLNLVDVPVADGSIPEITAVAGAVTFPSGIPGLNSFGENGWEGPCLSSGSGSHTYRFNVYVLQSAIGAAVDNLNSSQFESAYSNIILSKSSFTGSFSN